MEVKTKQTWGGAREGAGRKSVRNNVKTIGIRVPQDVADILDRQENKTDYIIEAITYYEKNKCCNLLSN